MGVIDDAEMSGSRFSGCGEVVDMRVFLRTENFHVVPAFVLNTVCTDAVIIGSGRL